MAILTPEEIREFDIDAMAIRVFLKSLELIGGPRKLIEYRNLTWIPSLMEASYAVVLRDMANKTEAEIAEFLGSTRQTVRNMLRAEPELVLKKLEGELEEKTPRAHTAGGLAKLAYKEIKEGRENLTIFLHLLQVASESLGVFWPVEILRRMKGADFPLGKEELLERLKGLKVKEKNIEEILEKLSYPVKSPADLLAQIREKLEAQ
ncbi:MAG: bacterio-opsin activator [Candidatus Caldipriscus sp.]|jgi:probable regulatory domain-containing protein